jgi:hypothetical protein
MNEGVHACHVFKIAFLDNERQANMHFFLGAM